MNYLYLIPIVMILLLGFAVTFAHHCTIQEHRKRGFLGEIYTIALALIFTASQGLQNTGCLQITCNNRDSFDCSRALKAF